MNNHIIDYPIVCMNLDLKIHPQLRCLSISSGCFNFTLKLQVRSCHPFHDVDYWHPFVWYHENSEEKKKGGTNTLNTHTLNRFFSNYGHGVEIRRWQTSNFFGLKYQNLLNLYSQVCSRIYLASLFILLFINIF